MPISNITNVPTQEEGAEGGFCSKQLFELFVDNDSLQLKQTFYFRDVQKLPDKQDPPSHSAHSFWGFVHSVILHLFSLLC